MLVNQLRSIDCFDDENILIQKQYKNGHALPECSRCPENEVPVKRVSILVSLGA